MTNAQREEDIRKWFANHVAILSTAKDHIGEITTLEWAQPGTWNCRIVYMMRGGILLVYGDLGDAVYQWGDKISLEFLAGCSLDYFTGKCQASEEGRGGKEWDEDLCRSNFISHIVINYELTAQVVEAWITSEYIEFSRCGFYETISNAGKIDGNDIETYELGNMGERPSGHVHAHLIGLKMAHKQLKEKS